jgi:hypothetical protein
VLTDGDTAADAGDDDTAADDTVAGAGDDIGPDDTAVDIAEGPPGPVVDRVADPFAVPEVLPEVHDITLNITPSSAAKPADVERMCITPS